MTRAAARFLFTDVEDWYVNVHAVTVERRLEANQEGTLTWCPEWWRHPEAVSRLEALWRAWETCRHLDGEAPARWWWQHHDPIFATLSHPKRGPFADCKPAKHRNGNVTEFLPIAPAPEGWWGADTPHAVAPTIASSTAMPTSLMTSKSTPADEMVIG